VCGRSGTELGPEAAYGGSVLNNTCQGDGRLF
jgi:hypothetical protein